MTDDVHPTGSSGLPPSSGPPVDDQSPGTVLAASRERAGLSILDVAAATRIRSSLVRAIEADDYEPCGGEVYARGHIRAIAHLVGADAEGLVADFDRRYGRQPPKLTVAPVSTLGEPVREVTRKATRSAPRWPGAAIAALALIVVLLVVSWVVGQRDKPNTPTRAGGVPVATSPGSSTPPASTSPAAPTTTAPPSPSRQPQSGVVVRLLVTDQSSWVRVQGSDGTSLFEGFVDKGEAKVFHDATALSLRLGNSQVVELTVNGMKVARLPCQTYVCDLTYQADRTQAG